MNTYYGKTMDFVKGIKEVTKYQFDTYISCREFKTSGKRP